MFKQTNKVTNINLEKIIKLRRNLDIEQEKLNNILKQYDDIMINGNIDVNDTTKPILTEEGSLQFCTENMPEDLQSLVNQTKFVYNLGEDVTTTKVSIFPPPKKIDGKIITINRGKMNIASRIIFILGSKENLTLDLSSAGTKMSGSGKVLLNSNQSIQLFMGVLSGVDISFDNNTYILLQSKDIGRMNKIKKNPLQRYVIVIDFDANMNLMGTQINDTVKNLANNNAALTEKLTEQITSSVSSVTKNYTPAHSE